MIVDGAHNEDAAKKLKTSIERYFTGEELILIMGVFKDKEYEKIVQILCPSAKRVYTVDLPNKERTLPAEKLAECVRDCVRRKEYWRCCCKSVHLCNRRQWETRGDRMWFIVISK